MPCLIKRLTIDGLQPVDYSADSLARATHHEPRNGVYTITNTFETYKVLKLDAHLNRMEESARLAHMPLALDRARLRAALRDLITEAAFGDVRFRITSPADTPNDLILSVEPFQPIAAALIASGVRVVTVPNAARENAAAKTTEWMHDRDAIQKALPAGIYDAVLLDADGDMLENLGANFYAILAGELRTAGAGVLAGIAQQIVFEIAPSIVPINKTAVNVSDVPRLSEAFLTSASRGIVPIIEIDSVTLGDGTPGTTTRALRAAYTTWMQTHLETL